MFFVQLLQLCSTNIHYTDLRMRVDGRRDSVGGPPGVGDAHVHLVLHLKVELLRAGLDLLLEVLHIALLLDQGRLLVGLAAIDADS